MNHELISLSMSGGGVRAMAFHSGGLKYLAEIGSIERINELSTVSGGSLLAAMIYSRNGGQWPNSQQFLNEILPAIETLLTTTDLQKKLGRDLLLNPFNWRYLFSRANILGKSIKSLWGIDGKLGDLGTSVVWSINCTAGETGRRFRFKQGQAGDSSIGYFNASNFNISDAVAISAAYPLIGNYVLRVNDYDWHQRTSWESTSSDVVATSPAYKRLHLMDGGIYDNLGTEPLFNHGRMITRTPQRQLIVMDAGAPLNLEPKYLRFTLNSLIRVIGIATNQARALRIRTLIDYFIQGGNGGAIMIGTSPSRVLKRVESSNDDWQSQDQIQQVAAFPTNLKQLSNAEFTLISRHGYQLTKALHLSKRNIEV